MWKLSTPPVRGGERGGDNGKDRYGMKSLGTERFLSTATYVIVGYLSRDDIMDLDNYYSGVGLPLIFSLSPFELPLHGFPLRLRSHTCR